MAVEFPGSDRDKLLGSYRGSLNTRLTTIAVSDDFGKPLMGSANDTLLQILVQLQIMNVHLSLLTDAALDENAIPPEVR